MELGTFEEYRDGIPLKYKITTVPAHLADAVIDHMTKYFLPREPMCSHFMIHEDPESLHCIQELWRQGVSGGAALVAIREGPEEEKDRVIGANMTFVSHKGSKKPEMLKGTKTEKVFDAVVDVAEKANMFERYGDDKFLSALGLSVSADYHGYRVGERLLQCRKPLSKALGLKFTGTVFTHPTSIYLSKKVGFEVLREEDFSTYKYKGEVVFEGRSGKFVQSGWDFS